MGDLGRAFRALVASGGRVLVPYVTGGMPGFDVDLLRALEGSGADALEVGIPFSDPVMDGPVIQEASRLALQAGATPRSVLEVVERADLRLPVVAMTYANTVWHAGPRAFLEACLAAGVSGVVIPDLPVDEAAAWRAACEEAAVAPVFLAAPGTSEERLGEVAAASRGFVYCVATYGVTGERDRLSTSAAELIGRLRPLTELPLLVGVGIGDPGQARQACSFADGVIVGSALVRLLLEGARREAVALASAFRSAVTA